MWPLIRHIVYVRRCLARSAGENPFRLLLLVFLKHVGKKHAPVQVGFLVVANILVQPFDNGIVVLRCQFLCRSCFFRVVFLSWGFRILRGLVYILGFFIYRRAVFLWSYVLCLSVVSLYGLAFLLGFFRCL